MGGDDFMGSEVMWGCAEYGDVHIYMYVGLATLTKVRMNCSFNQRGKFFK